jgi:hypothetical protein
MVGVVDQLRALVEKDRPSLLEGDAVLPFVGARLKRIPFERNPGMATV